MQHLNPKPKTVAEIVALGYSRSTVKYYQKKLFNEDAYNKVIKKIQVLNKKAIIKAKKKSKKKAR